MVDNSMWEQLGFAVVEQAMIDYEEALVKRHKAELKLEKLIAVMHLTQNEKLKAALHNAYVNEFKAARMIAECEEFFNSKDCDLYLSNLKGIDGQTLMMKSRENVVKCDYNLKKLKKLHLKET